MRLMCQVLLTISKRIEEYIRNQLQDDIANDQLSLFESVDPFTGKKNSKK